jgi:hypothetical protein
MFSTRVVCIPSANEAWGKAARALQAALVGSQETMVEITSDCDPPKSMNYGPTQYYQGKMHAISIKNVWISIELKDSGCAGPQK